MTTQEIAAELCRGEKGTKEINIAQMCEVVRVLKKKLANRQGMAMLKGLLASLLLVLSVTGCGMIPADFKDTLDKGVKDHGAGTYSLACQLGKDGRQVVGVRGDLECTADMLQLTGCHKKAVTFEGKP